MNPNYDIDPELQLLTDFNAPTAPWVSIAGAPVLRALPKNMRPGEVRMRRVDLSAGGFPPRLYVISPRDAAADEVLPCLYYLHGGAFAHPAIPTQYRLMDQYAHQARCRVVAADYRLVGMHPYPAPLEDCAFGLAWAVAHAQELGIDPARMAIGGDSAGGSLALDTWLIAKDLVAAGDETFAGVPVPRALMLVYPVVDHRCRTASMARFTDTPIWDACKNVRMWERYLRGQAYTSPLERAGEFTSLTSAFIEVEEFDCLHDEGAALADALTAVDVAVTLRDNRGTYHGFEFHEHAAIQRESVAARVAFLREVFA